MRARSNALISIATALALLGCGGDDGGPLGDAASEQAIEEAIEDAASDQGEDVNVDVNADGEEISIESEEGGISIGGSDLPDGFPNGVPFPDDFTQQFSSGDGASFIVSGTSETSGDDLDGFYAEALPAAGYEVTERVEFGTGDAKVVSFSFTADGFKGVIQISTDPAAGTTTLFVTIETG
jgi:hypothetical protein